MRLDGFYGAPDLVVEVISSKPLLDRMVKKQKYADAGIPYYWLIDPDSKRFEAFYLTEGRYHREADLQGDALFSPRLFANLKIDLAELWV